MKRILFIIALSMLVACSEVKNTKVDNHNLAAWGVIQRIVPTLEDQLILKIIPSEDGNDFYEVGSKNGVLTVKGNNNISLCRGVYNYLVEELHCIVTWDGDQLNLPKKLPDVAVRRTVTPVKFRHYLNLCTAGYTMAFWDWERWEREIDWMALHGINMPLAMNGQEKVWLEVWKKMGLNEKQVCSFFSGPAFLPWARMGCLKEWGGPLPQDYIENDALLQKKILTRQNELGMIPILPSFSGFVPDELMELYPEADISKSSGWCDFEPTNLLEPRDPLFNKISVAFGEEYEKEYGNRSGYYIVDLYTEMKPQVRDETAVDELNAISTNVYKALAASDPNAVWIMQGWMFHFEFEKFWNEETVNSYLSGIPEGRLIVLDLGAEREEIWRKYKAIGDRQFIWNHLHNFGQHTNLFGMLDIIAESPVKALKDAPQGNLVGMGITMEGTEQNYIEYELMLDMMWTTTPMNLESWIRRYAFSRYGSDDEMIANIWDSLYRKYYMENGSPSAAWKYASYECRPQKNWVTTLENIIPDPEKKEIVELMLQLPKEVQKSTLFLRDLVDVSKDYFQEVLAVKMNNLIVAIEDGEILNAEKLQKEINVYIDEIDALLATVPVHRMDRWINMAKKTVDSEEDKLLLEKNARMLVTVWGGNLNGYAHKEWSGLASEYYKGRLNLFFNEYIKQGFSYEDFEKKLVEWEYAWCSKTDLSDPKSVITVEQVIHMLKL